MWTPETNFTDEMFRRVLQEMSNEYTTWRLKGVHRETDVPYFAGPGGVTSPDEYTATPIPAGWTPDFVKAETGFIGALLVRF